MIALYIILGIMAFILIFFIVMGFVIESLGFSKRFDPDPLVKYYTNEEFNIEREPLKIKVGKETIRGYSYNPNSKIDDAIVVFVHGMYATIDAYNQEICTIAEAGYEVIALNHIGVGTSTGKKITGLGGSLRCLDNTIDYVKANSKYSGRKIYVVGHSWGAYAAINIRKYHSDVNKIVAIAPFVSVNRLLINLLDKSLKPFIPFITLADICRNGSYSMQSAKSLKDNSNNILVLHSKNDPMVSFDLNTGYLMDNYDNILFIISNRNAHNPTYTLEAVEYMREYTDELSCTPLDKQEELKRNTDFHKMGELNMKTMNEIISFLNK